jgi:PAS domain S-box-containing protein/putative nucleotidyltransferase with HDIG domain
MGVILIAYERDSEQVALERLLTPQGHRVIKASNGLEALDVARREPPQAVVSDIVLPRMDGFALCRKWKQDERLQAIPFVFYTRRHDDPKYERFALELGAERFLARTEQPDSLLKVIDELLKNAAPALADGTVARGSATMPLPALDEAAVQRSQSLERAQQALALATERAQQVQARLRSQVAELESTTQRLASGEARFRRIFEGNPLPMWIADHATGGFIAVNDTALAVYGYTRSEFLALRTPSLVDAGAGTTDPGVQGHRRKDGSALTVMLNSGPIEFDGREADLVAVCDLSERVAAEKRRHQEVAASRAIIDGLADGYWQLDPSGRIVDVNVAYCSMSGFSREALLNMSAVDIERQGETTTRLRFSSGAGRYEAQHKRHDGSLMDVEVSVGEIESERGDTVALIRDISQRRREQVAQRIEGQQQEFLVELFRQSESFDESAIVRRVIEQAADITDSPLSYLFFVQPAGKTITLAAWRDRTKAQTVVANTQPRPLSKASMFTECIKARHPTSSNDLARKSQLDGLPDFQRYLAVPMVADDETVAILGVANREAGYGEGDQRLLSAFTDGVWRVLQAKRAHGATLSSLQRTDVALQGMIDALLQLSEKHDPYTAGSARRVATLAVALGREAGLDGERQHALRVAALLHDVGNVAIPPSILAKPGWLTEAETALMRTHVEEGTKLLAGIDFDAPVAEIIHQHHERFDGSGYPRAMKGEAILLEARILAIADVVEAMCSPRPHRPAVGIEAAIEEINRGAGIAYDLHLATACTRLVRQHGFTFPE